MPPKIVPYPTLPPHTMQYLVWQLIYMCIFSVCWYVLKCAIHPLIITWKIYQHVDGIMTRDEYQYLPSSYRQVNRTVTLSVASWQLKSLNFESSTEFKLCENYKNIDEKYLLVKLHMNQWFSHFLNRWFWDRNSFPDEASLLLRSVQIWTFQGLGFPWRFLFDERQRYSF